MKDKIEDFITKDGYPIKIGDILNTGNGCVTVVKTDDYETGFGFELEDSDGDRIYKPYFAVEKFTKVTTAQKKCHNLREQWKHLIN